MSYKPRTRDEIAQRISQDIEEGMYVNLGIGLPSRVANFLPIDKDIILHSENGVLGMGPSPAPEDRDEDLVNASKDYISLLPGGAFFDHGDSFAMMRGGHLDLCILGAFQVSQTGDLANWHTGSATAIPAVGGAMDLAVGAKKIYVAMEHLTKDKQPKIVEHCTYPLTGMACVHRIYTDLAVIDIRPEGLIVLEMVPGLSLDELQTLTAAPLIGAK